MKWNYRKLGRNKVVLCLLISCIAVLQQCDAQIVSPFSSSYFQNQYLMNPAMAGRFSHQLDFSAGYRKEGISIPDAPRNQYLTGTYGISDKVGVGVNIYNDKAGLINTTKVMATYAYHVPLNDKNKLLFGLSAGIWDARIDNSDMNGNPDDLSIGKFNDKEAQFDVDFGVAYVNDALTIQGAFPGIVTYFKKDRVDDVMGRTIFFTAVSYRFYFDKGDNAIGLEPKISYRNMKGFDDVLGVGANATFMNSLFNVFGMYHSAKSISVGAGFNIKGAFNINAAYNTGASTFNNYTKGTYEIGVGLKLKK